ncbi:hypothetical protein, partial [Klebsiella pneumoniae]|uniref:hypothetical protein n=1 Tax=Klebsiella pneumoniae TaxID=573 RepID=UPI0031B57E95
MTSRYVGCAKKARFQPYKVSFSPQRWNEKAWQLFRICGRMPPKSTLFRFRHPFFKEGANKQVISSQADSLIKISRIWAD